MIEKQNLEIRYSSLLEERDRLRNDLRDLAKARLNLIKEKEVYSQITKQKISQLEIELQNKNTELENKVEEYEKLDKNHRIISNERDKLKDRIQKLRNKRMRVDVNQKLCKKCGKDFLENENYNWSCRTHTSEFNVMYWC